MSRIANVYAGFSFGKLGHVTLLANVKFYYPIAEVDSRWQGCFAVSDISGVKSHGMSLIPSI